MRPALLQVEIGSDSEQFAAFVHQVEKTKSAIQSALEQDNLLFASLMQEYFG